MSLFLVLSNPGPMDPLSWIGFTAVGVAKGSLAAGLQSWVSYPQLGHSSILRLSNSTPLSPSCFPMSALRRNRGYWECLCCCPVSRGHRSWNWQCFRTGGDGGRGGCRRRRSRWSLLLWNKTLIDPKLITTCKIIGKRENVLKLSLHLETIKQVCSFAA